MDVLRSSTWVHQHGPQPCYHRRDWNALLASAPGGLRQGVTGKTIDGVYTGREVEAVALEAAKAGAK